MSLKQHFDSYIQSGRFAHIVILELVWSFGTTFAMTMIDADPCTFWGC